MCQKKKFKFLLLKVKFDPKKNLNEWIKNPLQKLFSLIIIYRNFLNLGTFCR